MDEENNSDEVTKAFDENHVQQSHYISVDEVTRAFDEVLDQHHESLEWLSNQ